MSGEANSSGMIRPIEEVMEEDGKRSGPCEASGKKRKTRARTNVLKSQSMENQCFPDIQFFSYYLSVVLLIFCFLGDGMEVDSEEGMGGGVGAPLGGQRTVFARLGHAGLSPLVLGEVSYREQQLYLNSLYHQVWPTTQFLWTGYFFRYENQQGNHLVLSIVKKA